jgi:hypothetical protein
MRNGGSRDSQSFLLLLLHPIQQQNNPTMSTHTHYRGDNSTIALIFSVSLDWWLWFGSPYFLKLGVAFGLVVAVWFRSRYIDTHSALLYHTAYPIVWCIIPT